MTNKPKETVSEDTLAGDVGEVFESELIESTVHAFLNGVTKEMDAAFLMFSASCVSASLGYDIYKALPTAAQETMPPEQFAAFFSRMVGEQITDLFKFEKLSAMEESKTQTVQ